MDKPQEKDLAEVWAFGVGNLPNLLMRPFVKRRFESAVKLIKEQEGFIGVHPMPPRGTLLLFRTENNAKGARNILRAAGIECGDGIFSVHIEKRYLEGTPHADK